MVTKHSYMPGEMEYFTASPNICIICYSYSKRQVACGFMRSGARGEHMPHAPVVPDFHVPKVFG